MNPNRKYAAFFALLFATLLLAGCPWLQRPQSFTDQLAYAVGVHSAVLHAAASSVEAGSMSVADGSQVLRLADESRALLETARAAMDIGDVSTAEGQLALATNILTQLQTYLRSRK